MRLVAVGVEPVGIVAIGANATGVIAFGQLATGVIAVGQLARGVIVVGQLAVGVVAFGQLALGIGWVGGMLAIGAGRRGPAMLGLVPRKPSWRVSVGIVLVALWWAVAGLWVWTGLTDADDDGPPVVSCTEDPSRAC